jgi:hypothetical protein
MMVPWRRVNLYRDATGRGATRQCRTRFVFEAGSLPFGQEIRSVRALLELLLTGRMPRALTA